MAEKTPIDIPFTGGLDTKIAAKIAGQDDRLEELNYADVSEVGAIKREKNYKGMPLDISGGGTLGSLTQFFTLKDQLCVIDNSVGKAYSYSDIDEEWVEIADNFWPCQISVEEKFGPSHFPASDSDSGWVSTRQDQLTNVVKHPSHNWWVIVQGNFFHIMDGTSGTVTVYKQKLAPYNSMAPDTRQFYFHTRVVYTNDAIWIVYSYRHTPGEIHGIRLQPWTDPTDTGTDYTLVNDMHTGSPPTVLNGLDAFRLPNNPNFFALVYIPTAITTVKTAIFNGSTGAQQGSTITSGAAAGFKACAGCTDRTTGATDWIYTSAIGTGAGGWIYYSSTFDGTTLTLDPIYGSRSINVSGGWDTATLVGAASPTATDEAYFYACWTGWPLGGADWTSIGEVIRATAVHPDSSPTAGVKITENIDIISKPFNWGEKQFFLATHWQPDERLATLFPNTIHDTALVSACLLMDESGAMHGRFAVDKAPRPNLGSALSFVDLGDSFVFAVPIKSGPYQVVGEGVTDINQISEEFGLALATVDFDGATFSAEVGDYAFISSGMLWVYDGATLSEAGFAWFPHSIPHITVTTSGGQLADGDYGIAAVFEWKDAKGNVYRSAPSPTQVATVSGGGGNGYITVRAPFLNQTRKLNNFEIQVRIYVSGVNDSTGTLYSAITHVNVETDPYSASIPDISHIYANELPLNPIEPTSIGELENVAPPSGIALTTHGGRLFLITGDYTIQYSKIQADGKGLQFTPTFQIVLDQKDGRASALASMDNQLVIFKEHGISRLFGTGPNDAGVGYYQTPIDLAGQTGAAYGSTVLKWPNGIIFGGSRGIWNLRRDFSLEHIGAPLLDVEGTAGISGGFVDTDNSSFYIQIGTSLYRYEYELGIWSDNTPSTGVNKILSARPPGGAEGERALFYEHSDDLRYLSSTYAALAAGGATEEMSLKTKWLYPGRINGFSRVKWIYLLGEYSAPHTVKMTIHYEDGTSESFSKAWSASDEPYVLRMKPARQKARAFQIEVEDLSHSGNGSGGIWHGISLVVESKRKLSLGSGKTL